MQTYTYATEFGGGVVLAPCDQVFLAELARCNAIGLLPGLFNLGEAGDLRHQLEGTSSDHNPFVTGPSGLRYIRAFDLGGPRDSWNKVIEFWNWLYGRRDARVYPYGYTNSDQPPPHGLTIWFGNGQTRQGSDGAHGHYSLNRANTDTVGRAAWTPALDDRSPWGLEAWLRGTPTTAPTDALQEDDDMALKDDKASQDILSTLVQRQVNAGLDAKIGPGVANATVPAIGGPKHLGDVVAELQSNLRGVLALIRTLAAAKVDTAALAADLAPILIPAIAEAGSGATAEQIADLLAQRLAS